MPPLDHGWYMFATNFDHHPLFTSTEVEWHGGGMARDAANVYLQSQHLDGLRLLVSRGVEVAVVQFDAVTFFPVREPLGEATGALGK